MNSSFLDKKLFRFPGKGILQATQSKEFLEKRRDGLEKFLNACLNNAQICELPLVQEFILKAKTGFNTRMQRAQTAQKQRVWEQSVEEEEEYEVKQDKEIEQKQTKQEQEKQLNELMELQKEINKNFDTDFNLSRTEKKKENKQNDYEQDRQIRGQSFQPQLIVTKEKDCSIEEENSDLSWNNFAIKSPLTKVNNQMKLSLQQPPRSNSIIDNRFSVKQPDNLYQQQSPYLNNNNLLSSQIEKQEKQKLEESWTSSSSKKNQQRQSIVNQQKPSIVTYEPSPTLQVKPVVGQIQKTIPLEETKQERGCCCIIF